jgi:hypothetical protein
MLRDGTTSARVGPPPTWLGVLQMAEAWGVPPWEIMRAPGSLLWAARWAAYRKEVHRIEEERANK